MTDSSTQSIEIAAGPEAIAAVITDFASYPEWAGAVKSIDVVEAGERGLARRVRFQLDAGMLQDTYELRYDYNEDLSRINWTLAEPSSVQRRQTGSYDIADRGDGSCTVTYTLAVELKLPMLGMLKRKAEKMIMDTALKELKKRVEEQA